LETNPVNGGIFMMKFLNVSAWVMLVGLATVSCAQSAGKENYKTNCTPCHGDNGDADTPAGKKYAVPSFRNSDAFKKTDAQLLDFIKAGKGDMPAWSDILSDDEVKDVIAYIRTLPKNSSEVENAAANSADSHKPKRQIRNLP